MSYDAGHVRRRQSTRTLPELVDLAPRLDELPPIGHRRVVLRPFDALRAADVRARTMDYDRERKRRRRALETGP